MPQVNPSAEDSWKVILESLQFAEDHLERWIIAELIPEDLGREVVANLKTLRTQYAASSALNLAVPVVAGIIPATNYESESVQAFRNWKFLESKTRSLKSSQTRGLSLAQFHALEREVAERLSAISRRLSGMGIQANELEATCVLQADLVADDDSFNEINTASGATPPQVDDAARQNVGNNASSLPDSKVDSPASLPRVNLLELLLDPRSIQWLLGLGGALMVVGLVILLWINEFFTPPVMAVALGIVNLSVLAVGFWLIRWTRFQLAGKALTLLSCLVMPLNLWYYSANSLVTLDGHLWVPAVVISAIYAAAAMLLKDEMFVYVFTAGVAMTGLLMVADAPPSPEKFWEIPYPATLLVVLGLISIHVERAFSDGEGAFSKKRFGLAFFWSGHVLMAAGLLLVFAAQLSGDWLYDLWFKPVFASWEATPSPICGELRWLALVLVAAATYGYVYSDLMVRRLGVYINIAAFTLLWAEVLAVQMLNLNLGVDAVIAVLAFTSLVVHVVQSNVQVDDKYTRSFPAFGLLLGILPVVLGGLVYFQHVGPRTIWGNQPPQWSFVGAMLLTAIASRVGAHVYRLASKSMTACYYFASGASVIVAAASALAALGGERWEEHAPILMLIPIGYLVAARLYGNRIQAEPVRWVAHAGALAMLASSLYSAFVGFSRFEPLGPLNLSLALFFGEAAVFYGLATWIEKRPRLVYLTTLMASGSLWQLLSYFAVGTQTYILVFAILGLLLLFGYRLSFWEKTAAAPLAEAFFQASNTLLSLAFVSSVFHGFFGVVADGFDRVGELSPAALDWGFAGFCIAMLVVSLIAFVMTQQREWRRWYLVTTFAEAAVMLLAVHKLIDLSPWQQIELFVVLVGLLLLAIGHLGWYREEERESDLVSTNLMVGAVSASAPLAIATWYDRYHSQFFMINEFGFLFVSVLLLATGLVFKLKATTIVGGLMTGLYFVTLLILVPWSQLNSVAIAITVGGGVIFGFGLVLAFFRDRILELPVRIKERQGLFRILNWR